jgi:ABC-type lipoprotein export system ATPase subunit
MTNPSTSPILEVRNLQKSYDQGQIEALRGVSLSIAPGEFVAISGPSGSGKSTLLQLLGGLDTPTSGEVLFQNAILGSSINLDTYRSHHVGFIFQAFHLMPTLRAIENVQVPMLAVKSAATSRASRAEALLREMGLEHRMGQYPNQLSAGERQRVAIARALANNPSILLADEPTGNLDSANSIRIMEMLTGIQSKRGMTLIVVTHENEIANSAPRHIRIRDGRIETDCVTPSVIRPGEIRQGAIGQARSEA